MPNYRDCFQIDVVELETSEFFKFLSLKQIGRLFKRMNEAYLAGDFDFLRNLPFVRGIYPRSSMSGRRKHIPSAIRREVLSSGPCAGCGTFSGLTIDHIIPRAKGGKDDRQNLQPMCLPCNLRKGAK